MNWIIRMIFAIITALTVMIVADISADGDVYELVLFVTGCYILNDVMGGSK